LLRHLGARSVRLMTNNPAKVRAIEALGITVADRMPVLVASNPIAAHYVETKRDRMAHIVPMQLAR
jgi:GTP cyclohydrolase II